jgi:hypothetical protein
VILLKDKTTTVTVGVSNVNTQISFEGKTIAGKYVEKTRPANSYTVHIANSSTQTMKQPLLMPQLQLHLQVVVH